MAHDEQYKVVLVHLRVWFLVIPVTQMTPNVIHACLSTSGIDLDHIYIYIMSSGLQWLRGLSRPDRHTTP